MKERNPSTMISNSEKIDVIRIFSNHPRLQYSESKGARSNPSSETKSDFSPETGIPSTESVSLSMSRNLI